MLCSLATPFNTSSGRESFPSPCLKLTVKSGGNLVVGTPARSSLAVQARNARRPKGFQPKRPSSCGCNARNKTDGGPARHCSWPASLVHCIDCLIISLASTGMDTPRSPAIASSSSCKSGPSRTAIAGLWVSSYPKSGLRLRRKPSSRPPPSWSRNCSPRGSLSCERSAAKPLVLEIRRRRRSAGYGLSECCSVVSVNRPGARRAGTVGRPLAGTEATIENGEIVVSSPTVMNGYLDEPPVSSSWRTGDLGHFDEQGFLIVTGRRDNIIVTAAGRNISPEWIEETIVADRRISRCVLVADRGELVAVVTPNCSSLRANGPALRHLLSDAARDLPDYAKPQRWMVLSEQEFRGLDLLTPNFRPRRPAIHRLVARSGASLSTETGKEEICLHT